MNDKLGILQQLFQDTSFKTLYLFSLYIFNKNSFVGKNKGDISIGDEYIWIRWGKDTLELFKDTKGYYINKFGKRIYGIIRCHDSQLDKLVSGISLSSFGRDLMYLSNLR